jgi:hypothetical protein
MQMALFNGGRSVKLKIILPKEENLLLKQEYPQNPSTSSQSPLLRDMTVLSRNIRIHEKKDNLEVIFNIGDIQPKDNVWTDSVLIGSKISLKIECVASLYANNLSNPLKKSLTIMINPTRRVIPVSQVLSLMSPK